MVEYVKAIKRMWECIEDGDSGNGSFPISKSCQQFFSNCGRNRINGQSPQGLNRIFSSVANIAGTKNTYRDAIETEDDPK